MTDDIIKLNPIHNLTPESFQIVQIYNNGIQKKTSNAIAEVNIETFSKLIKAGALFINMRNCKLYEHNDLIQCTNCQRYGHIKKYCKVERPCCVNCGEEHLSKDCNAVKVNFKCVNCAALNNDKITVNHRANDPSCIARKLRIKGIKAHLRNKLESIVQLNNHLKDSEAAVNPN